MHRTACVSNSLLLGPLDALTPTQYILLRVAQQIDAVGGLLQRMSVMERLLFSFTKDVGEYGRNMYEKYVCNKVTDKQIR